MNERDQIIKAMEEESIAMVVQLHRLKHVELAAYGLVAAYRAGCDPVQFKDAMDQLEKSLEE